MNDVAPLTDEQKELFTEFQNATGVDGVGLVSTRFHGHDVAVIVAVFPDEPLQGDLQIRPLYMLVTQDMITSNALEDPLSDDTQSESAVQEGEGGS
jgi:hypothetical protein